ncbi:bifunctional phosphopantothenoylcysteine decarboxylase/phosphopantothenate synthase [Nesterenkonia muleiensis]|uniref:bifunctional phosphopantothenoylcysteine decarboxylase/phosphopantothenate synthase n=1 Tax=Nesterenkonia muleiensis TaxID=2282648 RepID=UPI000E716ACD|nr:bifunctional phosphopantothenoylcysteine decarboxylase/phosphopantothenate synthase [Nesterenkonia muleiensis]
MRIVLGVSAGIAAYKAVHLARLLKEDGHHLEVIPTPASLEFVGRATWEAISGRPVTTGVFEGVDEVRHVSLGQQADLIVVAPATADLLARVRAGMTDDLLTSTVLASEAEKLLVPAMHTEMWQNPATVENVATLRQRGIQVLEPAVGRLTGKDSGPGRMPEPEQIKSRIDQLLGDHDAAATWHARSPRSGAQYHPGPGTVAGDPDSVPHGPLTGRKVVVTAGGTREPLDPVRYLGNRSSGKQGVALAQAAAEAGAEVVLITGIIDTQIPDMPVDMRREGLETASQLQEAVTRECQDADVLIMAAAVADFRPASYARTKIKKTEDGESPVIALERNPDILAGTVRRRSGTGTGPAVIVGFAAETGDDSTDPLKLAEQKLARKGCDLLVLNRVGENLVFGQDTTEIWILASEQSQQKLADEDPVHIKGSKVDAAGAVVDHAAQLLSADSQR